MTRRGDRIRPWREAELAVLDFETTGLDIRADHVLSFGVVPIVEGRLRLTEAVYRVVKPPLPLPAESVRVHGIRPADIDEAPPLEDVVGDLAEALSRRTLVTYAAWFELAFLNRLLGRLRLGRRRSAIDVIALARRLSALEGGRSRRPPATLAALADCDLLLPPGGWRRPVSRRL